MSMSRAEYKRLKEAAKSFARGAKPGVTYYMAVRPDGRWTRHYVAEIQLKKKPLVGLTWGSFSAEQLYIHHGPIVESRDHPTVAGLPTAKEMQIEDEQLEAHILDSKHWRKELQNAAGPGWSVPE